MATSQEVNAPLNPLNRGRRMPSWKRPGLPRKSSLVGTLARDKSVSPSHAGVEVSEGGGVGAQHRVFQLEKNIVFLKHQHRETLQQLHKEIERLKAENRDVHFKLVMCRCGHSGGKKRTIVSHGGETESEELRGMEEEVRELRNSLAQERNKTRRLMRVIEKRVLDNQKSSSFDQSDNESGIGVLPRPSIAGVTNGSRPPTLEECESIIQALTMANNQQSHELEQIKADLRDVLYSHKWTPDAFLLARAYVADEDKTREKIESSTNCALPNIVPARKMFDRAYARVRDEVTLPALKPHTHNSFTDRQRRTQALRNKLGRSLP